MEEPKRPPTLFTKLPFNNKLSINSIKKHHPFFRDVLRPGYLKDLFSLTSTLLCSQILIRHTSLAALIFLK